jgi:MFS transporter, DHA1 family, tetracycline resistance protein
VSQSLLSLSHIVGSLTAGYLIEHSMLVAYGFAAGGFAAIGALMSVIPTPLASTESACDGR